MQCSEGRQVRVGIEAGEVELEQRQPIRGQGVKGRVRGVGQIPGAAGLQVPLVLGLHQGEDLWIRVASLSTAQDEAAQMKGLLEVTLWTDD